MNKTFIKSYDKFKELSINFDNEIKSILFSLPKGKSIDDFQAMKQDHNFLVSIKLLTKEIETELLNRGFKQSS